MTVDLVCWDFGDTLVDELFMRLPPPGVPQWGAIYDEVLDARPDWVEGWMLGQGSINDLVAPLAERLPMTPVEIASYLRAVWDQIVWFDDARMMIDRLQGVVLQAVVTVNPYEFSGIARACGLDALIPTIVTSADLASNSKVLMANHTRNILGLEPGLATTVLIDNKQHNIDEFLAAGGQAVLYERDADSLAALDALL